MIESIKKYWFLFSSLVLAVLYYLYDRRGRQLHELHQEAQRQQLAQQLVGLQEKANESQEGFKNALEEYKALKSRHPELFDSISGKPGQG